MTRSISRNVLAGIRTSVAPVKTVEKRPGTSEYPLVLVGPPSSSRGAGGFEPQKSGVLTVDAWAKSLEELDAIYAALRWLDGHHAGGFTYRENAANTVPEPESWHLSLTYTVAYLEVAV